MRLVNYRCSVCGYDDEELFNDTEKKPNFLEKKCPACGNINTLMRWEIKNNAHRVSIFDRGGM